MRKNFLHCATRLFSLFILVLATSAVHAQPERFLPGRDYTVIENPVPDRTPDVVEVTEFFWYGCPGCFQFESQLAQWVEAQDSTVSCLRLPAIWDDWREVHARAYYTAASLNVLDTMHDEIFAAMHKQGNRLRNEDELAALFTANGIGKDAFTRTYNSFKVSSDIKRARNLAARYGARSTPSLIVNGKYLVNLSGQTLEIVDFLVAKEKRAAI